MTSGQSQLLKMMTESARAIQRQVSSMLQFAQIGHGEINLEPLSVEDVIESARAMLSDAIESSGAEIQYESLPVIKADRTQLEQVFQNLLSNAIKYRKPGDTLRISISAERMGGELVFSVEDNGQGVPPECLERVFEPLKRLHGRDIPGSGLGLAPCQRIIERHGGVGKEPGMERQFGLLCHFTIQQQSETANSHCGR